jgi:hypothetical protein
MKIYRDSNLSQEISLVDFGRVELGKNASQIFYLFNENNSTLSIRLTSDKVSISPQLATLKKNDKVSVAVAWNPVLTAKESLQTEIKIEGEEIFNV